MSYEEEEQKYLGYKLSSVYGKQDTGFFGSESPPKANAKPKPKYKMQFGKGDDDDDDEPKVAASVRFAKDIKPAKRAPAALLIDEDDAEDDDRNARSRKQTRAAAMVDDEDDMFKDMSLTLPVNRGNGSKVTVPLRAKQAAEELLLQAKNRDIALTRETRQDLDNLTQHPDEFTIVDPVVVITASVDTGTCRIHLKEVVPVSMLLLARVLGATFFVQVTPKAKTPATVYDEVSVRPFRDSRSAESNQPFGIEKAVEELIAQNEDMAADELMVQVKAYMFSVGPTSTLEASGLDFLELHTEAFKKILRGDLVPATRKKGIHERLQGIRRKAHEEGEDE